MSPQTFPEVLDTTRLQLRRYRSDDTRNMLALVDQNREQLVREFAGQAALRTLRDAESFVAQKWDAWNDRKTFCYGIWEKKTNLQVGQVQAKDVDWNIPVAELGYFIGKSSQRQGYASEDPAGHRPGLWGAIV